MATPPERTWAGWLEEAIGLDDAARTPALLAELVLAELKSVRNPDLPDPARLPSGQPRSATMRYAGAELLRRSRTEPATGTARVWHTLGLLAHTTKARRTAGDESELATSLEEARSAAAAAAGLDPCLELIALDAYSMRLRDNLQLPQSYEVSQRMLAVAESAGSADLLHTTLPEATWLPAAEVLLTVLTVVAHKRAALAARFLRDYPKASAAREAQTEAAAQIADTWPSVLMDALGQRSSIAREIGDVPTALDLRDRQDRLAAAGTSIEAQIVWHRSRAAFAKFLDEWPEERRHQLERIRLRLDAVGEPAASMAPRDVLASIDLLHGRERQLALTNLGNCSYEIARNLIESGRAADDDAAAEEADQWLDCADAAWRDIAMNGRIAIDFRRLELAATRGKAGEVEDVGRTMLKASRVWRRSGGQRRAAIVAVTHGAPGDPQIRARLEELLQSAPATDQAHLSVGLGTWHLRAGDTAAADAAAIEHWQQAQHHAESAADGFSLGSGATAPVLLDPTAYVQALVVQAAALRRVEDRMGRGSSAAELGVRVRSLPAIARRFAAAGTSQQRGVLWRQYASWLTETAELAVELGDPVAADQVAEVARRDLVGAVLRTLSEQTSPAVSRVARELQTTLSAVLTTDQLTPSLDVVGKVVGPLARSLFDPSVVLAATADRVLASRPQGPAAVLSLWLMPGNRLLRRLALRSSSGEVTHHLDVVPAPEWLAGLSPEIGHRGFFAHVHHLRNVLLPGPLVQALASTDQHHPLDLTIVPTGVLSIPFAALEFDDERLLLDLASIALVQSLGTAVKLGEGATSIGSGSIASYDTTRLEHTKVELVALHQHYAPVREASTLEELRELLTDPALRGGDTVLALALHGLRGSDGWSQTKQLPNGDLLTTTHVFDWYLPSLVISASCNTDIRADDGGELGGFPLAFQMRGAKTVIGALANIEDESTAQVMRHFYAFLADGVAPAHALRLAQLAWISASPDDRLVAWHRWAYLVAYGLPGSGR